MNQKRFYTFIIILSILAYSWLIYNSFFVSNNEGGITICWFKTLSGFPCPACGTTSGMIEIFKGNLIQAFQFNPFAYSSLFILNFAFIWASFDIIFKKNGFYRFYLDMNSYIKKKRIFIPLFLLILSVWIWNIYKSLC